MEQAEYQHPDLNAPWGSVMRSENNMVAVPDGMKRWHGGYSAPKDWDGGPVLLRDGTMWFKRPSWWHVGMKHGGEYSAGRDIIAYTPAHLASPQPDAQQGEIEKLGAEVERLRGLLVDPGSPPWEDARGILEFELRKIGFDTHADNVAAGEGVMLPSYITLNLLALCRSTTPPSPALDAATIERCAQVCEEQQRMFLSPQYAAGQPLSSFAERFAAGKCAEEIRALINQEAAHG